MSSEHPTDRGHAQRGLFERIAEPAWNFSSSPPFFAICVIVVLAWALSYAVGLNVKTHHVAGKAMAALTLLLVALLKNSELRAEHAIQRKLDAIAAAMLEQQRGSDEDAQRDLAEAIGLEEEV